MEYSDLAISGRSAVYGVIGDPVDHSLSPVIQNAAFQSAGLNAVYVPFQVKHSALEKAVRGLRALNVKGFNVMAPHKVDVGRYLDGLDESAVETGSVNTVLSEDGSLRGYNTDGIGALNALKEAGAQLRGKSVLLFGAGGTARALAYAFASEAKAIRLANRTLSKAEELERSLRRRFKIEIASMGLSGKLLRDFAQRADMIVNASSMGMSGKNDLPIEPGWLRASQWVFDVVYNPQETKLLRMASEAGAGIVTGLDMLVNQGACSFEIWAGRKAPIFEMRYAIAQKLLAMTHVKNS